MPFGYQSLQLLRPQKLGLLKKVKRVHIDRNMINFSLLEWAKESTITNEQILVVVLYAVATYTLLVAICWRIFSNQKKLSWCISLLNSFVMSLLGLYYVPMTLAKYNGNVLFGVNGGQTILQASDNIGIFTCTIFAVSIILDI